MDWLDALILGIVQGLAEYLPISSSGHLEIFREILGLDLSGADSLQFDVVLHVATVLSTIVILWKRFVPLCTSFFTLRRDENTTYVWKILLSCIPVGIVGVFFKDYVEQFFGGGLQIVGICLCVTAALLAFAYFSRTYVSGPNGSGVVSAEKGRSISWTDAFVIGCAQAVAVLPGLSRSGTTIATGIMLGDKRSEVAQFSFFMVIIPILGEALLDLLKLLGGEGADSPIGFLPMAVGFIASFVVGCLACKWMIALVNRGGLVWFALYCVVVGVLCICW
ncbi:MAG: undecaprenyl-diphosphate phosphatase [[Clostridium] fimetarium]|nr:undecaprenyl-diphosphate phosphatase [Alistipes timonensis]MCM1405282.1 undecaprenyl-diphosphate phosphatase [[Clostridium] fimetarium]